MAYNFEKLEELLKTKGVTAKEIEEMVNPLRSLAQKRKYGLVWEEQEEDIEKTLKDRYTVLCEVEEREIKLDEGGRTHSLIEGDNIEALTFLKNSGKKVDVIYIDPPYNTLSKDFRYNDHYVDKEDAWRHSKWLSFMSKRLILARDLLTDDGAIFISIDDNEMAQLKLLCDQVFGEQSFHGNITWIKKTKPINSGKARYQLQQSVEYVLCYTKQPKVNHGGFNLIASGERNYNKNWTEGRCRFVDLEDSDYGRKGRETMKFPILGITPGEGKRWKIGLEESIRLVNSDRIVIVNNKPKKVVYPFDEKSEILKPFWSHLEKNETGSAETGKAELSNILGKGHGFDTVKPMNLIKELLIHFGKDSTILDFFAGSGTTAHAVLELNREDGGNRQVILCTNNENNIAEEVTYERIKRVMEGYTTPKGKAVEGIPGNLRYFKVDSVDADEDIYTLEDNLLEVVVPFIQFQEDAWTITTGKPGFTYLDDRVTIYNDPYHLDEDFLNHIKGSVFYIYDGWMDYLDIEELKNIRVVPIPKEFFKLFR